MATPKTKSAHASYRFQRLHAALRSGHGVTVKLRRQEPVNIFASQGDLDSACGLHMLCMVLSVYGLAKPSALEDMSRRKHGVVANVWRAFSSSYFTGIDPPELVQTFNQLALPVSLTLRQGRTEDPDGFAVQCLMRGDLVGIATVSQRNARRKHWSLAVGIQGNVFGQRHEPDTMMLLDPSGTDPVFSVWNARLRKTGAHTWLHEGPEWTPERVSVFAAVRFRLCT